MYKVDRLIRFPDIITKRISIIFSLDFITNFVIFNSRYLILNHLQITTHRYIVFGTTRKQESRLQIPREVWMHDSVFLQAKALQSPAHPQM